MEKESQETEMSCPMCGFIMFKKIEAIPQSLFCPSCRAEFFIIAQISKNNKDK